MSEAEKSAMTKEAISNPDCGWSYRVPSKDFQKIPGSPIAYWGSKGIIRCFEEGQKLSKISPVKVGLQTGSNEKFVRLWFEVAAIKISFVDRQKHDFSKRWFPYVKGGEYRKWYGNNEHVVNWQNAGEEIVNFKDDSGKQRSRPQNINYYFKNSITWSFISSSFFGARYSDVRAIFDVAGSSTFPERIIEKRYAVCCAQKYLPFFYH